MKSHRRQESQIKARAEGQLAAQSRRLQSNLSSRPNRVTGDQIQHLMAPLTTALLAFRLDTAGTTHYHDLAAGLTVAFYTASRVQRHQHTLPYLQAGLDALTAVFMRADGTDNYRAEPIEIEAIELAVDVYRGILHVTSWAFLRRAISDAMPAS